MYKLGLPGKVKEIKSIELENLKHNDRGAIIVDSKASIDEIRNYLPENTLNMVCLFEDEVGVVRNKYNILTVAQAKGLEFERVIAVSWNMTNNQLYVACTRAIRDLDAVV